jgi:hypothetical protein
MSVKMTAEALEQDLAHFTGTQTWYRHGMFRTVLHTDGVQFLAEQAGAHWLVDIIAIAQRHAPRVRAEPFQVWTLSRPKKQPSNKCTVAAEDGNGKRLYLQRIPFTDFPLQGITLYCAEGEGHRVIMLPSEY